MCGASAVGRRVCGQGLIHRSGAWRFLASFVGCSSPPFLDLNAYDSWPGTCLKDVLCSVS